MLSALATPTVPFIDHAVDELYHAGLTQILLDPHSTARQRHLLVLKRLDIPTRPDRLHLSAKIVCTTTNEHYHTPHWLTLSLKVYDLLVDEVYTLIDRQLTQSDPLVLKPHTWGLKPTQYGYSDTQAMNQFWDIVRDMYRYNGPYPYSWHYVMQCNFGVAQIHFTTDTYMDQRMRAWVDVSVDPVHGEFPLSGSARRFKIASGGLALLSDAFDAVILERVCEVR